MFQNVSRGADWVGDEPNLRAGPTVIVHVQPIPFRPRARLFRDGIDIGISSIRRTPPESQSPRAKLTNYINVFLADRQVKAANPDAWAGLLDINGNLNEGAGQNLWIVRRGELFTPRGDMVLEGVSRATVMDLAADLGIVVHETSLDLFDAYTADEIFLSSTQSVRLPRPLGRPPRNGLRHHSRPGDTAHHGRLQGASRLRFRGTVTAVP